MSKIPPPSVVASVAVRVLAGSDTPMTTRAIARRTARDLGLTADDYVVRRLVRSIERKFDAHDRVVRVGASPKAWCARALDLC